jgi:aryl-alcohol dehydrogenase-like predicted oxidoreductase
MVPEQQVEFALGTIGIGKPWGFANAVVPSEHQAMELLERAFTLGIRYFDTAPSYGIGEERLGRFLRGLTAKDRGELRIATKFGEHWNADRREPFVDHSYGALARSLDGSLERLGRIDFLQLHKTTPEALRSRDVARSWQYAATCGVPTIGASVSDLQSADIALADETFQILQFPYNALQTTFDDVLRRAAARGMRVAVNRPFGMGRMLYENRELSKSDAFRFILRERFDGAILSGTKSAVHLEENYQAFRQAQVR